MAAARVAHGMRATSLGLFILAVVLRAISIGSASRHDYIFLSSNDAQEHLLSLECYDSHSSRFQHNTTIESGHPAIHLRDHRTLALTMAADTCDSAYVLYQPRTIHSNSMP